MGRIGLAMKGYGLIILPWHLLSGIRREQFRITFRYGLELTSDLGIAIALF